MNQDKIDLIKWYINKSDKAFTRALKDFQENKVNIFVVTDVAAR
jgi:superfamily II DNA/RNA helicase